MYPRTRRYEGKGNMGEERNTQTKVDVTRPYEEQQDLIFEDFGWDAALPF